MDQTNPNSQKKKKIEQHPDGTCSLVLYLNDEDYKRMKKLADKMGLNDFDTIKYALRLVSWWSRNEIEPEAL